MGSGGPGGRGWYFTGWGAQDRVHKGQERRGGEPGPASVRQTRAGHKRVRQASGVFIMSVLRARWRWTWDSYGFIHTLPQCGCTVSVWFHTHTHCRRSCYGVVVNMRQWYAHCCTETRLSVWDSVVPTLLQKELLLCVCEYGTGYPVAAGVVTVCV